MYTYYMQMLKQLKDLLYATDMTYEEIRAFELGIIKLSIEDQVVLYRILSVNSDIIYPTYINYMAKRRARETGTGWEEAVETELANLERLIEKKRIGEEVTPLY